MEKIAFPIAIAAVLLVFNAKILSLPIAPPHPLCLQQFALANQACSLIPYDHAVPTSVDKPGIFTQVSNDSDEDDGDGDEGEEDGDEGEGDGDDDEGDDDDEDDGEDRQSGQDHGNRGGHGGSRRHHSPRASRGGNGNRNASGNGSTGSGGGGSGSRHGRRRGHGSGHRHHSDDKEGEEHGHRSRRRHRRHHSESRESSECCKWLEEVDASCVCDLLIRLPNFLRRPSHAIMIKVQDSCNVTYECPGRFLE